MRRLRRIDFSRLDRASRRYDRWKCTDAVATELGPLPLIIQGRLDEQLADRAVDLAQALGSCAERHEALLRDIVCGHYLAAERAGQLGDWGVPAGLRDEDIFGYLGAIELVVKATSLSAAVVIDVGWDPERKLTLSMGNNTVVAVNGQPWALDGDGVLQVG